MEKRIEYEDEQAMEYLNSLAVFGIKPGLERLTYLLDKMGNPQKKLKFIHIAGTNGKGSTSVMTANILQMGSYKTGLYISPYVLCFRECMQINGDMISKKELTECAMYVKKYADAMLFDFESPTQYEVETAIAFEWFMRQNCDVVCLEVGLGGRFDATNVIDKPLLQVITAISLDHTAILGDTIEKIAFEKAGIIKGATTILYPLQDKVVEQVIKKRCHEENSELIIPDISKIEISDNSWMKNSFSYKGVNIEKSLSGLFQIYNAVTVYEMIQALNKKGFAISKESVYEGIKNTFFPARMEIISQKPLVILDGAHNPSGIAALETTLKYFKDKKINIMMGMLADKNYEAALGVIAPYASNFIAVTPPNSRALSGLTLSESASKHCKNVLYKDDFKDAVIYALQKTGAKDVLIICGSLYLASAIRPILIEEMHKY